MLSCIGCRVIQEIQSEKIYVGPRCSITLTRLTLAQGSSNCNLLLLLSPRSGASTCVMPLTATATADNWKFSWARRIGRVLLLLRSLSVTALQSIHPSNNILHERDESSGRSDSSHRNLLRGVFVRGILRRYLTHRGSDSLLSAYPWISIIPFRV